MTQKAKVLDALERASYKGDGWVSGKFFLRELYLSQYHARIFELQDDGIEIEASKFTDEFGYKSYRLKPRIKQESLI